jgi:hypothetical protein
MVPLGLETVIDFLPTLGTVAGSAMGVIASSKVWQYRIQQLEKKVEKHNNLVERTYRLEGRMTEAEHEIHDLKEFHRPN